MNQSDEAARLQRQAEFEALSPLRQLLVMAQDLQRNCYRAANGDMTVPTIDAEDIVSAIEEMVQAEVVPSPRLTATEVAAAEASKRHTERCAEALALVREVLTLVEWESGSHFFEEYNGHCPVCDKTKYQGHDPACKLAQAIAVLAEGGLK